MRVKVLTVGGLAEFKKRRGPLSAITKSKIARALRGKKKPGLARRVAGAVVGRTAAGRAARIAGLAVAAPVVRYGIPFVGGMRGAVKNAHPESLVATDPQIRGMARGLGGAQAVGRAIQNDINRAKAFRDFFRRNKGGGK